MNILEYLSDNPQKTAREIAKVLKEEKSKINRVLYLLEDIITIKNTENQWSVTENFIPKIIEQLETPQTARELSKSLNIDKKIINKILYNKDLGFTSAENSKSSAPLWSFNKSFV